MAKNDTYKKGGEVHIMKRVEGKKRRVTILMGTDLYAQFHEFAEQNAWSDARAGLRLITLYFLDERKEQEAHGRGKEDSKGTRHALGNQAR